MARQEFRLYVGNIPFKATEDELRALFAPRRVQRVHIVTDKETQQPRGFAFVTVSNEQEKASAITDLNQTSFGGRTISVSEAHPRPPRVGQDGGGGGSTRGGAPPSNRSKRRGSYNNDPDDNY